MRFLILLCYYRRPNMVMNAINSLQWQGVHPQQIDLVFVDDSGPDIPLPLRITEKLECNWIVHKIGDTPEQKTAQGGSRFGSFWNEEMFKSSADVALMLCDDDALFPNYLQNLERWFTENPTADYCHSHVAPFDPFTQTPPNIVPMPYWLNHNTPIAPSCVVDASQVAWKIESAKRHNIRFPDVQTRNLDAALYGQMHAAWGNCLPTGFIGQYKGVFGNQLSYRTNDWAVIDLPEPPV